MSSTEHLKEADRVMVICNSCRYCEGFCAVFPAMERRRTFTPEDLKYLANLCHNCRDCYYACQFAPPHEYDLNVPKALAELRLDTYRDFAWPTSLSGLFKRNASATALIAMLSVIIVLLLTLMFQGPLTVFSSHVGENAFYKIIPYLIIVIPMSALGLFVLASLFMGVRRLWQETGGRMGDLFHLRANLQALKRSKNTFQALGFPGIIQSIRAFYILCRVRP